MPVDRLERLLLACGAVGAALFVIVFLVAGATRAGYSPLRHPVSSLALAESGWVQVANFLVTGVLVVAFAFGVRLAVRRSGGSGWAPLLIGVAGVALICAGLFPTDPLGGYPPGTPAVAAPTAPGTAHNLVSAVFFLALPAACFVFARLFAAAGNRGWAGYSLGTGLVFLAGFVLTGAGFRQLLPTLAPIAGLLQRITLVIGMGWLAALAIHLLRNPGVPTDASSDGPGTRTG